jgi:hypothetical protein
MLLRGIDGDGTLSSKMRADCTGFPDSETVFRFKPSESSAGTWYRFSTRSLSWLWSRDKKTWTDCWYFRGPDGRPVDLVNLWIMWHLQLFCPVPGLRAHTAEVLQPREEMEEYGFVDNCHEQIVSVRCPL